MDRYVCVIALVASLGQTIDSAVVHPRFDCKDLLYPECRDLVGLKLLETDRVNYHIQNIGVRCMSTCYLACGMRKRDGAHSEWNEDGTYNITGIPARFEQYKLQINKILYLDQSKKQELLKDEELKIKIKHKCAKMNQEFPYSEEASEIHHCYGRFCWESFIFEKCMKENKMPSAMSDSQRFL